MSIQGVKSALPGITQAKGLADESNSQGHGKRQIR